MIVIRRTSLVRFLSSKWALMAAVGIGMLVFIGCGQSNPEAEDFMIASGATCVCDGTTLHCNAQNNQEAVDVQNSEYCNIEVIKATGVCTCDGAVLSCNVGVCTFDTGGCAGLGASKIVTACHPISGTNSQFPGLKANPLMSGLGGIILFPNDSQCVGGGQPPPPPPPSGGTSGGGDGECACSGVDYICKAADGSVTSARYNAGQCGGSEACNCREPNKTLACPDGTYADFNPQCTGGGEPSGLCGNGVCDADEPVTCPGDCPKP